MQLNETALRYKNAEARGELVLPIELVGTTTLEEAKENLDANMSHPIWLEEYPAHDGVAIVCGNGPSLADTLDEIRELDGVIYACNDAANLLIENGIEVHYQVILEAHPRAVDELADANVHLLASMVNPELFRRCKNAILWHPNTPWVEERIPKEHPPFVYIGGASTVSMFALSIAHTMGFRSIHTFGLDSSHKEGKTHASREFDIPGQLLVTVNAFGKDYKTSYDMKEQVRVFMVMQEKLAELGTKVAVHGYGLLPDVFNATCSRTSEQTLTT